MRALRLHGIIHAEFKKFVVASEGGAAWNEIMASTGLGSKVYLPNQTYDDAEVGALFGALSTATGKPIPQLLEAFGEFIAPDLLSLFKTRINPAWRSLDVIEHTERMVHQTVRLSVPGATPPRLRCTRESPDRVVMMYDSQRHMCSLAIGIIHGLAREFQEKLTIQQPECMSHGAKACRIVIEREA